MRAIGSGRGWILLAVAVFSGLGLWGAGAVSARGGGAEGSAGAPGSSAAAVEAEESRAAAPVSGLDRRVRWTRSRVAGSPEPAPDYRTRKAYPKLDLEFPIAVAHQPGSPYLYVINQGGAYQRTKVWRFKDDPGATAADLELLLDQEDTSYGFAFHPRFAENGYMYIGSNGPKAGGGPKVTRVTRYTVEPRAPFRFDAGSALEIISWESDGHNGGDMTFGLDGMMYVTSGDGTSDSDTNLRGQDLTHLTAKVLRIDVDRPAAGMNYSVPADNPFLDLPGARPETWAYGLRNPWRITCDRRTGHIWVGNNGQDMYEQIYFVRKGENYGWSVMEGGHRFYADREAGPHPFAAPAADHPHSEARSLTGGIVYYGPGFPELHGMYIYGDYSTGKIWGIRHDGERVTEHRELYDSAMQITGFGTDSRGEILICDHLGGLHTLERNPNRGKPANFPRTLSETGIFESVAGHRVDPGLVPYSVNSPLWSDGAHKERFAGIPGDGQIGYTSSRGWNFPNGTVLVKSFALEAEEGNADSRFWIETRIMTRQENEWFGYTYAWNAEQTEATLVGAEGLDAEFATRGRDGSAVSRKWRYPSRTECMVCHTRAANFTLGLCELQMNRDHDYGGGRVANQLATLEHIGMFEPTGEAAERARAQIRERGRKLGLSGPDLEAYTREEFSHAKKPGGKLPKRPAELGRLVNPYDEGADLQARAKSYLHTQCAGCHVEAGGGNAQMELEFATPLERMRIVDVKPSHHDFGLPEARLIAPGAPERSVLLHRISHRGEGHMPPLATELVDEPAVDLIRRWIASMPSGGESSKSKGE